MSIVESSIDYKLNKLQQTWVGTIQNIVNRGDLGTAIDGLTKLSEAIGWVIDKFGVLGTTAIVGGGILGANNLGKTYKCMVFKYNCFEYALHA